MDWTNFLLKRQKGVDYKFTYYCYNFHGVGDDPMAWTRSDEPQVVHGTAELLATDSIFS